MKPKPEFYPFALLPQDLEILLRLLSLPLQINEEHQLDERLKDLKFLIDYRGLQPSIPSGGMRVCG